MAFSSRLELVVDTRTGAQRLREFEGQLDRTQGSGDRLAKGMGVLKIALGAAAAAAGGFSLGQVVRETASFEQSLLQLQVVSGATATQMAALESQSRQLGATSAFSAKQAADAQNFLAMAGMNVNQVLSATPGILQLATAGNMDLARAADLASNVLGAMKLEVSELSRVNDVLAATANGSNTSIIQLGEALSYAAPLAATAGVSIEETAAAIGVLSDAGLQSSRAGTGLVGVIRQLSNVTPQAAAALQQYGLTTADVNIEQNGLLDVLDKLQKANIGTTESFQIFGSEAGAAANILASGAVRVNEFTGELELAEGTAERAALVLGSGLEGSFRSLNSAIGESTLQLGRDSGMSAALQEVVNTATGVISVYNGMLPQFQQANDLTEDQARNLNTTATAISLTAGAVGGLTSAYVGLTAATWAAHAAQTAFVRIMRVNPIVLAAGAIASLSGALYTARNRTIEFGDTTASVSDWLQGAWSASAEVFAENWSGAVDSAVSSFEWMAEPVGKVVNWFSVTFEALMTSIGTITQTTINSMIGYFGTIGDVVGIVTRTMQELFSDAFDNILDVAGGFWESIQAVFSGDLTFSAFNSAVENLKSGFVNTMSGAADEIGVAFRENMGRDYLGEAFDSLSGQAQFLADDFTALGDRISDAAFVARMSRNGFGLVAEGFSEGKTQAQLLQEQLDQLNQSLADPASEEAAKAAKTLADNFESLKRQLDPSYSSLMDFWEGIELLNEAIDTSTIEGMTEYNRLVGLLTERYAEATKGSDETRRRVEQLTQQYDRQYQRGVALTTAIDDINAAYRRGDIDGQQYGRMIQGVRDEMAQLALEADPMAQEMARAWEEAGNRIDETFADAFRGAFDSFESFSDQLMDGFKRLLAELAYQATLKPIVVGFTQDMQGLMSGGRGGFGNTIGAARSLFSSGSSLLGGGAAAAAPSLAMQGGLSSAALASASQVASGATYGGALGSAASGAALGNVASTGIMSSITAGVSAAMPWIAGGLAIDSLLGGGITKAISGLFGGSKTAPKFELATVGQDVDPTRHGLFENYGEGVYSRGALGTVGFYDPNTARLEETFDGFDNAKAFLDGITALDNAMVGAVANLDNGAEKTQAMANAAQAVRLNAGDAAGIANQLATRTLAVVDVLDGDFSVSLRGLGLDAEQITGRVVQAANAMQLLDASSARLNLQFDASAAGAMRAADGMAQLMGGADNLNASLGSFYDTFYTEEEKLQHLTEDLSGTFASMGRELPTTREGVRDVVESLDLMGAAGQEQLATILQLNGPLSQYIAAMEEQRAAAIESGEAIDDNAESMRAQADIARERAGLEREWLQLQGNTEELRRRELAGIDESNRALQQRIWAFKDEQAAAEQAAQAQQQLMNGVQTAYQAVDQAVNAERQILENAYRETTASINRNMQTVQDAMSTTERAADGLQSTLDQMMGASAAGQQSQFETASDYLRSVLSGGGLGDPDELDRALSAVANPSQDTYETLQDYQRDFLSTANVVDQLRDRADEQLTTEERSLRALERQLSQADLQFEREMSALDSTLETQREMLEAQFGAQEWLSTVNNSVLSVADAIAALEFKQAQAVAGGAGGGGSSGSGSSSLTNAQIKAFADNAVAESGGDWDAAGVAIGNAAIAAGVTSKQLADALGKTEQQVIDRTKELGLPGFASGGIATGPTSGYPVELHGTEAIIPLKGGNVPLHVPGIQALIREVSQLRKELAASQRAIAEHTRKSARVLEREEVERRQEEVV